MLAGRQTAKNGAHGLARPENHTAAPGRRGRPDDPEVALDLRQLPGDIVGVIIEYVGLVAVGDEGPVFPFAGQIFTGMVADVDFNFWNSAHLLD